MALPRPQAGPGARCKTSCTRCKLPLTAEERAQRPAYCGAGVVDAYIAAAGAAPAAARSAPDAAAAGGASGAGSGDGGGGDGGRAAFLLDTALRSMAGRNFVAARARLTLCRAALLARLGLGPEEHGGSGGVSGGAASAASCEEQGGRSEGAAALGRAEPGAGDGSGGTGAAAAGQASPTAEGRAAAGGGGEAGSAGKPGAAGRDSGSAAAAGHRESARDPVREGGAGGSADQLACQLGAVCGSLVRAQARCAGCMYTLQWLHGLPHCRTAWDREACVRTLVCAETRAVALQTRPAGPAWHSCDGAPHAISCAGRVQQKHTEVSRQCLFPPLLSVSTTLLPTRHKSRCPPASGAGVAVAGCGSL